MSKSQRKQLATTVSEAKAKTRLDIVKEWLTENYVVRVNLLDRSRVSLSPTDDCSMKYEYPITEEDILLHAYAEEMPLPGGLLKMLLASPNQMEAFNPISDYFTSLRGKYKGPSQIDLLVASLHLSEVEDTKGILKNTVQRAGHLFRKWIVATAACALGIRQNDVALGLVGEKAGIGKTTFFEQIVPPCLKEYYQVAQKDERVFPMQNAFTQRFLLNFDEFAAITKANEQLFKLCMSADALSIRRPGSRYVDTVPRVASCCFTSNKNRRMGGFIRTPDPGTLRRLAAIEVDAIDDYRQRLDVDQLWAEAVMLLDGGFDPVWTQEEYRQFVDENRQYVIESNALRLLRLHYRMPGDSEEGVFMTPMEIVLQLKEKRKLTSAHQRVDETTVGQALSVLGYKREIKRVQGYNSPRHGYFVVPMFE